jgi:NTP pyrophosphatase (non-canonical NTP hydrolase)
VPNDRRGWGTSDEDLIAEMLEEGHTGKPEGFPVELADAVIRLFGLAYEAGIDLPAAIEEKLAYNATRPFKHGKQF